MTIMKSRLNLGDICLQASFMPALHLSLSNQPRHAEWCLKRGLQAEQKKRKAAVYFAFFTR